MNEWFSNNIGTILAGLIVLVIVGLIVFNMFRRKKRGEKIIDCGGSCGSCGGSCAGRKPAKGKKKVTDGNTENTVYTAGELGLVKTVLTIDGMMCDMCESHMNDCIRNHFDIKNVYSSHKKGETVVISKEALDEADVRRVVEATGYRVLSFTSESM